MIWLTNALASRAPALKPIRVVSTSSACKPKKLASVAREIPWAVGNSLCGIAPLEEECRLWASTSQLCAKPLAGSSCHWLGPGLLAARSGYALTMRKRFSVGKAEHAALATGVYQGGTKTDVPPGVIPGVAVTPGRRLHPSLGRCACRGGRRQSGFECRSLDGDGFLQLFFRKSERNLPVPSFAWRSNLMRLEDRFCAPLIVPCGLRRE
jgi:hypothetical protein